jgi:hypothetical protein
VIINESILLVGCQQQNLNRCDSAFDAKLKYPGLALLLTPSLT